jgi:hypothetical protein
LKSSGIKRGFLTIAACHGAFRKSESEDIRITLC